MQIGVSLVDNKKIRALNKKYLGRDYATDVLSFNYLDDGVGDTQSRELDLQSKKSFKLTVLEGKNSTLGGKSLTSDVYLGDIVVSTDKAKEQAESYGNSYEQEIADLVAHGVLHLLGIHHKGDDHEAGSRAGKSRRKVQK